MKKLLFVLLLLTQTAFSQSFWGVTKIQDTASVAMDSLRVHNTRLNDITSSKVSYTDSSSALGWYRRGYIDAVASSKVSYTDSSSALGWYRRAYFDAVIANINLNVALKANIAAPTFTGKITTNSLKLNNLTSGYIPYQDATRFRNSPISVLNGNVGIGTTTPGAPLHIKSATNPQLRVQNSNANVGDVAGILFGVTTADNYQQAGIFFERLGGTGEGSLHFATKASGSTNVDKSNARMTIDKNGNVGIGTTDLDGTPAIGQVTIKSSANDGTSNILIGRNSAETNVFRVTDKGSIFASGSISTNIVTATDGYTVGVNDNVILLDCTTMESDPFLVSAASCKGREYTFKKKDNSVNIADIFADGSDTIEGDADYQLTNQYQTVTLVSDGVATWYIKSVYP